MKIVFDLDGVLREINSYLVTKFNVPYPQNWLWKYKDKDIFDWIKQDDYRALIYAPTTKYFLPIKKKFENIELWTCQPEKWKPYTKIWLKNHFEDHYLINYLNTEEKRRRLDEEKGVYLVEDCPNFSHYKNILLIDRPYNRHIEAERICS